ncbi:DUF6414 family protein [Planococcus kocurii]|uniref:DUF6414 family protein n=1 Tax=Planococcus kocurii TaxID=1374 RepID=UPI003CFF6F8A
MKKIIYFDESSALDILDIKSNGRTEKIMETMVQKASKFSLDGKIGTGILDFFNFGISANSSGQYDRGKSNILKTNLTNTILTSFLDLLKKEKSNEYGLEELKDSKLTIPPDSAAFIKSIAPFIKFFKSSEEFKNTSDPILDNIDLHSVDDVLLNAKGYYELLAIDKEGDKKVVRFNLDGFRNNYKLNDLEKMNLTLYGVKVGTCLEENLSFEKELAFGNQQSNKQQNQNLGYNPHETNNNQNKTDIELDIIDIVLAGIRV